MSVLAADGVWVRPHRVPRPYRVYTFPPRDREIFVELAALGFATSLQIQEMFWGGPHPVGKWRVRRLVEWGLLWRWEFSKPYPSAYSLTAHSAPLVGAAPPPEGLLPSEVLRVVAATEFYVGLRALGREFRWRQGPWGFDLHIAGREYRGLCPRALPGEAEDFWMWVRAHVGERLMCVASSEEEAVRLARSCPDGRVRYTWDGLLHSGPLSRAFRRWDGSGFEPEEAVVFA